MRAARHHIFGLKRSPCVIVFARGAVKHHPKTGGVAVDARMARRRQAFGALLDLRRAGAPVKQIGVALLIATRLTPSTAGPTAVPTMFRRALSSIYIARRAPHGPACDLQ